MILAVHIHLRLAFEVRLADVGVLCLPAIQAHSVLDDLLYNIVHDLLLKTHRDEKMARANTAAISVEKLAMKSVDPAAASDSKPDIRVENEAAAYDAGKVTLKGNPLKTTTEILCPRCHLPRLLHPTDGKGARQPDPNVTYCKKQPYINKPGFDIYGQTWVAPGPGRGKKKKDMKIADSADGTPVPDTKDGRPPNVLSYPSATCSKCKRCILVTRLNNHMGSCIGNSGRNASRAAAQKISNGSNGNSQNNDNTPPSSQRGTPLPGSRAVSPKKRDADQLEEDGEDADEKDSKKKKLKPTAPIKKGPVLKIKGAGLGAKKDKVKGSSLLSGELKLSDSPKLKSVEVAQKKSTSKIPSPAKKVKLGAKPALTAAPKPSREADAESESSGTLSSPPR